MNNKIEINASDEIEKLLEDKPKAKRSLRETLRDKFGRRVVTIKTFEDAKELGFPKQFVPGYKESPELRNPKIAAHINEMWERNYKPSTVHKKEADPMSITSVKIRMRGADGKPLTRHAIRLARNSATMLAS